MFIHLILDTMFCVDWYKELQMVLRMRATYSMIVKFRDHSNNK